MEEGDGLARTGDEVVGIYAQLGTSTRIVCFLREFVSRWISGVFLSGACEPIDQRYVFLLRGHTGEFMPCTIWWDSGAPELIPPKNGGLWAPGGLPP